MDYYIYMTTNLINNKKYIGQHKGIPNDSYLGSGVILAKAIKQYGKENFRKEILCFCKDREEANQQEKRYIQEFNAVEDDTFYNIDEGGYREDIHQQYLKWRELKPEEAQKVFENNGKKLQEWCKTHSEEYKKYCIEPFLQGARKWTKNHPEEVAQRMIKLNQKKEEWRKAHPEEYKKQVEEWRKKGSKANSKPVINLTTGKIFPSQSEAGRYYNIPQSNISKCLKGERKFAGSDTFTKEKYRWAFYKSNT